MQYFTIWVGWYYFTAINYMHIFLPPPLLSVTAGLAAAPPPPGKFMVLPALLVALPNPGSFTGTSPPWWILFLLHSKTTLVPKIPLHRKFHCAYPMDIFFLQILRYTYFYRSILWSCVAPFFLHETSDLGLFAQSVIIINSKILPLDILMLVIFFNGLK